MRVAHALVRGLGAHDDEGLRADLGEGADDRRVALDVALLHVVVDRGRLGEAEADDELEVDAVRVGHEVLVLLDEGVRALERRAVARGRAARTTESFSVVERGPWMPTAPKLKTRRWSGDADVADHRRRLAR